MRSKQSCCACISATRHASADWHDDLLNVISEPSRGHRQSLRDQPSRQPRTLDVTHGDCDTMAVGVDASATAAAPPPSADHPAAVIPQAATGGLERLVSPGVHDIMPDIKVLQKYMVARFRDKVQGPTASPRAPPRSPLSPRLFDARRSPHMQSPRPSSYGNGRCSIFVQCICIICLDGPTRCAQCTHMRINKRALLTICRHTPCCKQPGAAAASRAGSPGVCVCYAIAGKRGRQEFRDCLLRRRGAPFWGRALISLARP